MSTPEPNEIDILDAIYQYLMEKYGKVLYNNSPRYIIISATYMTHDMRSYSFTSISPQLPVTDKTRYKLQCRNCDIAGNIIHESIIDVREPNSLETIDQLINKWHR